MTSIPMSRTATGGSDRVALLIVLSVFAVLAAATLVAKGVLVERFFHDVYMPIDMIWRSALGQIPHVDYHSPVGQAFMWPYRLLATIGEPSPLFILRGNLLVGGFLLLLCLLTLRRRLRPVLFAVATVGIVATAMSPRDHDSLWYIYSHLAPYTRWGFALAMLVALLALLPRAIGGPRRGAWIMDAVVLGVATALLYYLKLNFFVGAVGFIGLGLLLRQLEWRTAAAALAAGIAVVLLVEVGYGNNVAYLSDVRMAATANGQGLLVRLFGRDFLQAAALGAVEIVAGFVLLRLTDRTGNLASFARRWWRELAVFIGMIGIVVVVHTQNNYTREVPVLSTAFLLLVELALRRRGTRNDDQHSRAPDMPSRHRWVCAGLIAVFGIGLHVLDSVAIVSHSVATHESDAQSIPSLRGTPGEELLVSQQLLADFPHRPELETPQNEAMLPSGLLQRRTRWRALTAMEVRSLDEAVRLLKARITPGTRIFSVDFGNPFPAFFRLPPPSGSLPWWDPGRSYSLASHPSLDVLLGSTDIVAHRRVDTFAGVHSVALWQLIGPHVMQRFRPAAQGPLWTLWQREAAGGSPLPQ